MTTRSLLAVVLSIVAVATIGLCTRYELKKRSQERHDKSVQEARQKREIGYQLALLHISRLLRQG
jgi:putative copper export protein